MLDLIIIGAGPAGITAAVYAARKRLDLLVVSKDVGGQAGWSGDIENYTGYQFITGPDLVDKFAEHMRKFGIALHEGEPVTSLSKKGNSMLVTTAQATYEARTVIVASGKRTRELGVPGEKEFKNKGLTYCATCDGPLFPGKDVAVIGGGNSALDAALQLVKIARTVTVINMASALTADPVMVEALARAPNAEVMNGAVVKAVSGDRFVTGITIEQGGQTTARAVQGVFVEIGLIPNSDFATLLEKNERGEIRVNNGNATNVPGIFAAGDVTDVPEKQIIIAAGEGSKAALSVFRYLIEHEFS